MNEKELSFNYKLVSTAREKKINPALGKGSGKSGSKSHGLISFNTLHSW
jgi:hypothetical protein